MSTSSFTKNEESVHYSINHHPYHIQGSQDGDIFVLNVITKEVKWLKPLTYPNDSSGHGTCDACVMQGDYIVFDRKAGNVFVQNLDELDEDDESDTISTATSSLSSFSTQFDEPETPKKSNLCGFLMRRWHHFRERQRKRWLRYEQHETVEGILFFYDRITGQSTWQAPHADQIDDRLAVA